MRAKGRIAVQCESDIYDIRASSAEDSPPIDLKGRRLRLQCTEAKTVFAGAPLAELREAASEVVIEWKAANADTWSPHLKSAVGLVTYRARQGDQIVARRKALVLPAGFEVRFQSVDPPRFRVVLAPGWFVGGMGKPSAVPDAPGEWYVNAQAVPGRPARAAIMLRPPASVSPSLASIELVANAGMSGFRDLVTGEPAPCRTTLDRVGRFEACISKRAGKLIFVSWGGSQSMPVICEQDQGSAYGLPLSWIAEELRELDASRPDIDSRIRIAMFDEGRSRELDVSPIRLARQDRHIVMDAGGEPVPPQIELTARHFTAPESVRLERDAERDDAWVLPEELRAGWSLVTASLPSIRPLAIKAQAQVERGDAGSIADSLAALLQADAPMEVRRSALAERLAHVVSRPLDGEHQEDVAFLSQWLDRFSDVPASYLDLVQALLGAPETALRWLAYSGASRTNPLTQRASESPLWWHLVPMSAWISLPTWWATAVGEDGSGAHEDPAVLSDLVTAYVDCLHVTEELRATFASVMDNIVIRQQVASGVRNYFAQSAKAQLGVLFKQWDQRLAAELDNGARLPSLPNISGMASDVGRLLPDASPNQPVGFRLPYLIAPAACAVAGEEGGASRDLRRELVLARRFDRSLFDSIFVNSRILLTCT